MEDLNVNLAIWRMFMNTTLRAAVHLGKDYDTNLRFVKNYLWKTTGQLVRETEKLISGQTETTGKSWSIFKIWGGYRQAYCAVELVNNSLPKSMHSPILYSVWERWETILLNPGRSKFNGIRTTIASANWIELMDNLWNSSGRFSQDSLQWESWIRFNRRWEKYSVDQRISQARSCSCQSLTTLYGMPRKWWIMRKWFKNNSRVCWKIPSWWLVFPRAWIWEEVVRNIRLQSRWILASNCSENAAELRRIRHPIFRCTSALKRGQFWSKGGGKTSIHFNRSTENIELLLQMVISVSQLSSFGAVADMIEELPVGQKALGKPAAPDQLEKQEILTQPLAQGNLLQEYKQRFERSYPDYAPKQVWDESKLDFFHALPSPRGKENQSVCPRIFDASRSRRNSKKGWMQSNVRFGPVSQSTRKIQYWSSSSIFVSRSNRILD